MRVIVCGGRGYSEYEVIEKYLDRLHAIHHFDLVIHGAQRGADRLAEYWARNRHIDVKRFPAEWGRHGGKAAGPIRNLQMIKEGLPDLVIAFPGGRGTHNMKMQAGVAGLRVIDLALEDERRAVAQQYGALKAV